MSEKEDPKGILVRFLDGPLEGRGNITSAAGSIDTFLLPSDTWDWPLPQRLNTLSHLEYAQNVAMWDAEGDGEGLPEEILNSENVVVYMKVMESKMPRGTDTIVRGATYRMESR